MSINPTRIATDIDTIASFSEAAPAIGYSRPTFSPAWRAARDYIITEAQKANCTARIDPAGNVHIRPKSLGWKTPAWLCGSHIDSVPTGGKYDGVVGVVVPLELLRADPTLPLELIIFAEEEGTTFNLGMLGSRAWAGTLDASALEKLTNKQGQNFFTAAQPHGVIREKIGHPFDPSPYLGLIEVHVEQGLSMWNTNTPVAVVTAINGRLQYTCTVTGSPNHAGSTKMHDRKDALAAAAEMLLAIESLGTHLQTVLDHTVATVGRITIEPNALNVIPGRVTFSIDFRARSNDMLQRGAAVLKMRLDEIAARRKLACDLNLTEELPAMPLDESVCNRLKNAAKALNIALPEVASGALHDAAILAPLLPTAMLFIASEGGISHNPAEFSRLEDITLAARILAETVRQ